jgi:UDP-N-acetylglucosamine acyltransferase
MTSIDESARVASGAVIGADVAIGPFCVIGPDVVIGDGCRLIASVHLTGHTTIGPRTVIYPFSSLGTPPQSTRYRGGPTRLTVGADCDLRESVTMNRTEDGGGVTIGDRASSWRTAMSGTTAVGNDVVPLTAPRSAATRSATAW